MDLGKRIAGLRVGANMSQEELAGRLFVSNDLVSKWETGKRRPDWAMIEALAAALGVTADSIVDRNELMLEDLEGCLPEDFPDDNLSGVLNDFLRLLRRDEADIFMRRYYFLRSVKEIAADYRLGENHVRTILSRTRRKLRKYLKEVQNGQNEVV